MIHVEVDDENLASAFGERPGNVNGVGGLPYPALLIADGNDSALSLLSCLRMDIASSSWPF